MSVLARDIAESISGGHDDHKFSAYRPGTLDEASEHLLGRAQYYFLVYLGEFPTNGDTASFRKDSRKHRKRLLYPMRRFIKYDRPLLLGNFFKKRLSALFMRKETEEKKFCRRQSSDG